MARIQTVAGIDIGTNVIKVLVAKKDTETGKITEVMSLKTIESAGVQKGRVKSPQETAKKLAELFNQIQEKSVANIS